MYHDLIGFIPDLFLHLATDKFGVKELTEDERGSNFICKCFQRLCLHSNY